MKVSAFSFAVLTFGAVIASCTNNRSTVQHSMAATDTTTRELTIIDSLLQDRDFAVSMAMELDAAYYKGIGETAAPFLQPGEDSLQIDKSIQEEKIAAGIAGLYALECGINYLCSRDHSSPAEWIERIVSNKEPDINSVEILNRFANATWKAGQPFRSLDRIRKPNFIGWSGLTNEEKEKDHRQIQGVAKLLQPLLQGTKDEQLQQIKQLLQRKEFAIKTAAFMDSSYYAGEQQPVPAFPSKEEATITHKKSYKEEKIAINVAGFYALECGLNYFVKATKQTPSAILKSVIDDTLPSHDKLLFCRFANATWKAGQPFRSLDRITRDIFVPFNFLNESSIEKDWVQVKTAAEKLLKELK